MPLDFVDLRMNQIGVIEDPLGGGRQRVGEPRGLAQIVPCRLGVRPLYLPSLSTIALLVKADLFAESARGFSLKSGLTSKFRRTTNIAGEPASCRILTTLSTFDGVVSATTMASPSRRRSSYRRQDNGDLSGAGPDGTDASYALKRFPGGISGSFFGGIEGKNNPDRFAIFQARPRARLVRRHTKKSTPNTRVASLAPITPAAGPAAMVMTAASIAMRAKTIIHPSIYKFSGPGRVHLSLAQIKHV